MEHNADQQLELPIGVVSRVDVNRLLREVEALDDFLAQAAIRQPGTPIKLPRTSHLLDECMTTNKLNVLQEQDRTHLHSFLISVKAKAPTLHMSFGADPSPRFTQRLMTWLRAEIHPLLLLQIGLQPNIGAGCIVRTPNRQFDFSLRQHFFEHRERLVAKLDVPQPSTEPAQEEPSP